ncbi:GHKL domain-containing protein [Erysipelothrix piscisicarius]|uniref:GHKL domain-containing protein n=1 Tax=Erysipelothrix piscisicarius TaxID=2485784 RepID=A0A3Q8S820_9FIRM|nr:GHKL domain-containing protein [Erysipelothrix piscisicarius]AZK44595.1 GHKL domain-containing protein [Erysipelothrix piscisicarius]
MMYLILAITSTITYYFYTYLSVYFLKDHAEMRSYGNISLGICMVMSSMLVLFSRQFVFETYISYLFMLLVMFISFKIIYKISSTLAAYATVRHVFYFYTVRGFVFGMYSLLSGIPIRLIASGSMSDMISFQTTCIFVIILFLMLQRYSVTTARIQALFRNTDQVLFVTVTKLSLGFYLTIVGFGSRYTANDQWFTLMYLFTCVVVMGVAAIVVANSVRSCEALEYEKQTVALQKQLDMQVKHYKSYQVYTQSFREFRHDYKNTLSTINALLRKNDYETAIHILDEMGVQMSDGLTTHPTYSNDSLLDAIMQEFANTCNNEGITFECMLYCDQTVALTELEVVRIFTNLLKNAHEATLMLPEEQRFIKVKSKLRDHWIDVMISNRFDGNYHENLESTKTTDKGSRGLGFKIVRKTIEQLGGIANWSVDGDVFKVVMNFPRDHTTEA